MQNNAPDLAFLYNLKQLPYTFSTTSTEDPKYFSFIKYDLFGILMYDFLGVEAIFL